MNRCKSSSVHLDIVPINLQDRSCHSSRSVVMFHVPINIEDADPSAIKSHNGYFAVQQLHDLALIDALSRSKVDTAEILPTTG